MVQIGSQVFPSPLTLSDQPMNLCARSLAIFLGLSLGVLAGCGEEKSDSSGQDDPTDEPLPSEGLNPGECTDGADNDGDGDFDCNDSDCAGSPDCSEANTPGGCSDGADNDRDGLFDCDDPDCASDEACAGVDYEGDDPGECDDGLDNDDDGAIDCDDEGCEGFEGCEEDEAEENCSDGIDNDDDGATDCDDSDCDGSPDCDPLGTAANPATSCLEIRDEGVFDSDGEYWVNPDGGEAFELYCSMSYEGGGWALISLLGTCSQGTIQDTVTDGTACSYLSPERVTRIASAGDEVMLRTGYTFYELTQYTLSVDSSAVEALRSTTGTWHNGAKWSDWDWAEPTCPVSEVVTGWPEMYMACGSTTGVHWIRQSAGFYFHQRTNNGGTGLNELATTWIR